MTLASIANIFGVLALVKGCALLSKPNYVRHMAHAFPRNRAVAYILTIVDIVWIMLIMLHADLGRFEHLKPYLYIAAPVAILLIAIYIDELLAPRAVGGFLLLLADPVLDAARWHDSSWSMLMSFLVYLWIIYAMLLILSPYRYRQAVAFWVRDNARMRLGGIIATLFGIVFLVLGITVY